MLPFFGHGLIVTFLRRWQGNVFFQPYIICVRTSNSNPLSNLLILSQGTIEEDCEDTLI